MSKYSDWVIVIDHGRTADAKQVRAKSAEHAYEKAAKRYGEQWIFDGPWPLDEYENAYGKITARF